MSKIVKLYICKNREIKITFRNCLIFREQIIYNKQYIIPHLKMIIYSHEFNGPATSMNKTYYTLVCIHMSIK